MNTRFAPTTLWTGLTALALGCGLVLPPAQVLACGGCFVPSTASSPTVQQSERVLFVRHPKSRLATVWVEIRYTGPANDFGWVVPVPALPKVGVGSRYVFDRLDLATDPVFETQSVGAENCRGWFGSTSTSSGGGCGGGFASFDDGGAAGLAAEDTGLDLDSSRRRGVQVVEQDQVGPYDYAVVTGTNADGLYAWLTARNYQIPAAAKPILESHIAKGDLFVALRLKAGAAARDIQPIALTMPETSPCVPLRLTSIAATNDLNVQVYVAGAQRAIPKNHLHVVVNPTRLQWFDGASNYQQVLSAAIDEAGGRAFATEYAGPMPTTVEEPLLLTQGAQVWRSDQTRTTDLLGKATFNTDGLTKAKTVYEVFVALKKMQLPITAETVRILEETMQLAELQQFAGTSLVSRYLTFVQDPLLAPLGEVSGRLIAAHLRTQFLDPLQEMHVLLQGQPYLTRLVLRISPNEMTKDPLFAEMANLPMVSNRHTATVNAVCRDGAPPAEAYRLALPGLGSWVFNGLASSTGFGPSGPLANNASDPRFLTAPAALRIELLDETTAGPIPVGPAAVDLVDSAIAGAQPGQPSMPAGMQIPAPPKGWKPPPSDPTFTSKSKAGGFALPLLLLLVVAARRRGRPTA